jgi:3',5'-nucleoside bisphosphate phosphatase
MQYRFYFFDTNGYYAAMTIKTNGFIDLHMHSNFSDGAFSPSELVMMAKEQDLVCISIADHDSVAGLIDGLASSELAGIDFIPAIEISVQFNSWHDVHLLGYGIDFNDRHFQDKLSDFRERRKSRNVDILARVNESLRLEGRQELSIDEVLMHAKDSIGRPHIARALLERGYVRNIEDSFQRYLIPCNIPKHYWPIADAIAEIKRLHGVAVLAHPTSITTDRQQLCTIITELKALGLEGIEVFNNMAQIHEMEFLRRRTEEAGLLVTAGSDYHGIEEGLIIGRGRSGIRFSDSLLIPLKKRLLELKNGLAN